jgi:hypothetical protein
MRKDNFLDPDKVHSHIFHFDFAKLVESNFTLDPLSVTVPAGMQMEVAHTQEQSALINRWISQYGRSESGLGRLLGRAQLSAMYRVVNATKPVHADTPQQAVEMAI